MSCLGDIGEDGIVDRLRGWLRQADSGQELLGDDCAVLPSSHPGVDELLTSDSVVEGIHFEAGTDLEKVGRKAVNRALSDIAAMAGEPQYLLLNVGAPASLPVSDLQRFFESARDAAAAFGGRIAGGDLTRMDRVEVHVFCCGRVPAGRALLRRGAQSGDRLYVTGRLGGSFEGRHLDFTPRIQEAVWLREKAAPTAMMDVSDGLAADLPRLALESGVGMQVNLACLPVSDNVPDGDLARALEDGEDYELLFTVPRDKGDDWTLPFTEEFGIAVTEIGDVLPVENGLTTVHANGMIRDWPKGGYRHF